MTRQEIYKEMEGVFGLVPSFFRKVPDSSLELEWKLWKLFEIDRGAIPNKYRELIGVAISAVTRCHYCSLYHTEMAKTYGAADSEIEEAVHFAKSSSGWSTYLNGLQLDYEQFKSEVERAAEFARSRKGVEKELACSDVGGECEFVIRGKSEQEIFEKAAMHAKTAHNMEELPQELIEKARAAIHSVG